MKIIITLLLCPLFSFSQVHNRPTADVFLYKEIGDTIFINSKAIVPGDTLYLGKGSAPDGSFVNIYNSKAKGLPKSNTFLVFEGRKRIKGYSIYQPVFISANSKKYIVNFYPALETREINF